MAEENERFALTKLVSVPGLVSVAILGAAVAAVARLFGPENVLKEVVTELVASLGSTVLVLAVFGLFFRTGLERLLRGAPGGEALSQSAEHLKDLAQGPGAQYPVESEPRFEAKLGSIGRDLRFLVDEELPALRREMAELRELLADGEHERHD